MSTSLFDGLSQTQLDALCNVAFGGYGAGQNRRTLESLVRRGLISEHTRIEQTGFMPVRIKTYGMDISTHMKFCQWCVENYDGDTEE